MSEQEINSNNDQSQAPETETLYAGKFKTVAELEAGYKNSLPTFQENETLKKQLESVTKVPEEYQTPAEIALHQADLAAVIEEAKNSGLTQAQYERLVKQRNAKSLSKYEQFENAKKELGSDNLNLLQDFINKSYPAKAGEVLLKQAISNKEIRESILAQRQAALASTAPGLSGIPANTNFDITEQDVLKAREQIDKLSGKAKIAARDRYIAMQYQRAHSKDK